MPGLVVGDGLLAQDAGCEQPVCGYSNEQRFTTADRIWFCLRVKISKFDSQPCVKFVNRRI